MPPTRMLFAFSLVAAGFLCLDSPSIQGKPPAPRLGDAWTDPENPVAQRYGGKRLDLWSFKKPALPELPQVKNPTWVRNPIDAFILARIEAKGLTPSPEADRRTLIRRVSFDLLGLPPSPEDVLRFVADPDADAYEKLVDRLLASKHYGERWGRHWLDVVRYADTEGYERDEFRVQAWRYRDYVIRAFNEDRPYNEFIREQLAGDELAAAHPEDRAAERLIATGFLRLGPYDSTAGLFGEDPRGRDFLMADLVNTTGSAFLGLTLACCQCHDHKYDPLLQADHFRIRAFFAAVKFRNDLVIDPKPVRAEIAAHNARIDAQAGELTAELDAILKTTTERVVEKRRAEFPEEVRKALKVPEKERDQASKDLLKPYLEKLKVEPKRAQQALNPEERVRHEVLSQQAAELMKQKKEFTTAMGMADSGPNAPATHIFAKGNYTKPLDEVPAGFLSLYDPNPAPVTAPAPSTTGRRTALADWIASKDNPLTARALVNRLWQHHFGRGIVPTPNDFGYSGTPPTHPELLDWLAIEFMKHGWSIKHVHRRILLSATYRQASTVDPQKAAIDSDNLTWWRQSIRRLEGEVLRDAMLAVSGKLLPIDGGAPVWPELPLEVILGQPKIFETGEGRLEGWYTDKPEKTDVRSVFTVQKRSVPLPMLQSFDLPDSTTSCGARTKTTVAPQALELLNSAFSVRLARELGVRAAREAGEDEGKQVVRVFWLALGRGPDAQERDIGLKMLARHRAQHGQPAALVDLCRVLLNVNEFLYIDSIRPIHSREGGRG